MGNRTQCLILMSYANVWVFFFDNPAALTTCELLRCVNFGVQLSSVAQNECRLPRVDPTDC